MEAAILARDLRSTVVEHQHRGHLAVVKGDRLLFSAGDSEHLTLLGDCGAPFAAAAFCKAGLDGRSRASSEELALLASRHDDESETIERLRSLLRRLELSEDHLRCGSRAAPLRHPASGRHVALLALARKLGGSSPRYLAPDSPARRSYVDGLLAAARLLRSEVTCVDEGCGFPTLAMPLRRVAGLWSVLADPGAPLAADMVRCLGQVTRDMRSHGDAVGGPSALAGGLMSQTDEAFTAMTTPGGLFCIAAHRTGWGAALLLESGREDVAAHVVLELLKRLELLPDGSLGELESRLPKLSSGQKRTILLGEALRRCP